IPLWVEFPEEESTFSVDSHYMLGGALLACPVTEPGIQEIKVLLPGSDEVLQDSESSCHPGHGNQMICYLSVDTDVSSAQVPVFQRGGTVVCRSVGSCSCTADPDCNLLSLQGTADGELYLDDGHSFRYRDRKAFCLRRFSMLSGRLLCRPASEEGTFDCNTVIQSVTILGVKSKPSAVIVHASGKEIWH
uniref:Glucosidase, alpha; neutral C n=1 Tax=Neolamprologus brichardi TaxID=32507 RepID=A0A3Q4GJX4_NEOBR